MVFNEPNFISIRNKIISLHILYLKVLYDDDDMAQFLLNTLAIIFMKKNYQNRLFAWILTSILIYPISVNFAHILVKNHGYGYQTKSIEQIHLHRQSCAIYHHILNYNTPIVSNTFIFKVYTLVKNTFVFKPIKIYDLRRYDFSLRAPPFC